jgi:hypothetical protein
MKPDGGVIHIKELCTEERVTALLIITALSMAGIG